MDSAGSQHRDLVERESDGNYLHTVKWMFALLSVRKALLKCLIKC